MLATALSRSFLLSADVSNGLNPDFTNADIYAKHMVGKFNVGMVVSTDPGQGMTTDLEGLEMARRLDSNMQRE
jgi:aspartyl aminopeptidase